MSACYSQHIPLTKTLSFSTDKIDFPSANPIMLYSLPILVILLLTVPILAGRDSHVIKFRSPNLYPESVSWDPLSQHFVVGSLRGPTLLSISDAGVVTTLVSDASLPSKSCFAGVSVDRHNRRLLAAVFSHSDPSASALAAYDLKSPHRRLFLTPLPDPASSPSSAGANDVAVDFAGNAFVTNSASNLIYKVNPDGEKSVFSNSSIFTANPVDPATPYSSCGLNGVVYINKGYLLVTQTNTGKLYKVNAEDGTARRVLLNRDLTAADGIAVRSDGIVIVVSQQKVYFIKSDSGWAEGVVFDETALDEEKFASSVTVGGGDRVYVLYGYIGEGMKGNVEREEFNIVEVESEKESGEEDGVWVYVLIGLGLAYFLFWRFQMRQLVTNMDKKRS